MVVPAAVVALGLRIDLADTFAEAAIFAESYHCTATAITDAVVIECPNVAIKALIEEKPSFSSQLLQRFAVQLQRSRRQVELLSIKAADQRIIAAMQDGLLTDDIGTFADTIGLASETVYRTLKQLTDTGVLNKTSRGKYHLSAQE